MLLTLWLFRELLFAVSEIETNAATQDKGKTLSDSVKSSSGIRSETERVAVRQIPLTSSASRASQEERRRRKPEEFGAQHSVSDISIIHLMRSESLRALSCD